MVEVADQGAHHGDPKDHPTVDAQNDQGQVSQSPVDDDFHPVETKIANPVELQNGVVKLVEFPQPGDAVEEVVHAPLNEVLEDQKEQKLGPQREGAQQANGFGRRQRETANRRQSPVDEPGRSKGNQDSGVVSVEDEPEKVLPDLFSEGPLNPAPGNDALEDPAQERDYQEPEEVVARVPDDAQHVGPRGRKPDSRLGLPQIESGW